MYHSETAQFRLSRMVWKAVKLILFLLSCSVINRAAGYRPVFIMHGILQSGDDMKPLEQFITTAHPGTPVHIIDAYNNVDSLLTPMWKQVEGVYKIIAPILDKSPNGAIFIGYSQGGLVLRGILEAYPTHDITFIALASPVNGVYGVPPEVKEVVPFLTTEDAYSICFLLGWNQGLSLCNYWKDPRRMKLYRCKSTFVYPLEAPADPKYKTNFEKLAKLVLIGGPDDGVLGPWQSCHFGFIDNNNNIVSYKDQQLYKDNTFGLKTLDESGRIHFHTVPGVKHTDFYENKHTFECCIKPYLD